jgi:small-conductance mechanosensitive channel
LSTDTEPYPPYIEPVDRNSYRRGDRIEKDSQTHRHSNCWDFSGFDVQPGGNCPGPHAQDWLSIAGTKEIGMTTQNLLLGIGTLAVLSNAVILILIMAALDRRGYKTNILWARLLFFKYLSAYKKATTKEIGKPGLLFYLWIITINIAAVAVLLAVIGL